MMMRAMENTIYFASVGYATKYQEAASCIISRMASALLISLMVKRV
jgi:hypothetical protein